VEPACLELVVHPREVRGPAGNKFQRRQPSMERAKETRRSSLDGGWDVLL
jgi:hypothetical protein